MELRRIRECTEASRAAARASLEANVKAPGKAVLVAPRPLTGLLWPRGGGRTGRASRALGLAGGRREAILPGGRQPQCALSWLLIAQRPSSSLVLACSSGHLLS